MRDKDQILLEHIVTEVIVEPYEYEWTQQTQKWWNGYFKTENDTGIKVSITNHWGANHWEIIFSTDIEDKSDRDLAYIRQDTGNPFKVFKTVHIMLDEFLQNKKSNVDFIEFRAEKENQSTSKDSRVILYNRFIKNWEKYFKGNWSKAIVSDTSEIEVCYFIINNDNKNTVDKFKEYFKTNYKYEDNINLKWI